MTGYECYNLLVSLNNHFFSNYDYFKYNGKSALKPETFQRKTYKEQYMYEKLGKKFSKISELENFIISNILLSVSRKWVGDLLTPEADSNYAQWVSRTDSLTYLIKQDMAWLLNDVHSLLSHGEKFNDLFRSIDHQHPRILIALLQGEICIETFMVLDLCVGFFKKINRSMDGDPIWSQVRLKCENYMPFLMRLKLNVPKLRMAIKEIVENANIPSAFAAQNGSFDANYAA